MSLGFGVLGLGNVESSPNNNVFLVKASVFRSLVCGYSSTACILVLQELMLHFRIC